MLSLFGTLSFFSSQTDLAKLQLWAGVGALVGLFLFWRGFSMLRCKRIILNTPSSKVRSASMGLVEISGMAKGPRTIPAGLTGEACYYYRAMAWQLRQSGNNRQWKKVADESLYVPFFVEDATGDMLVDPQDAELDIHRNFKDEVGDSLFSSGALVPDKVGAFMLRNGISFSERTRLEEYCIKLDSPLFVLGTLGQNLAERDWIPTRHVEASSFKSHFTLFGPTGSSMFRALGWAPGLKSASYDVQASSRGRSPEVTPVSSYSSRLSTGGIAGATSLNAARWASVSMDEEGMRAGSVSGGLEGARRQQAVAAATSVATSIAAATSESDSLRDDSTSQVTDAVLAPPPSVAISKGTGSQPFMISCRSQREVVQALARKSALCIWGGPALTLGCVYFLVASLGWT
jgi:E3 Ubiquitin ligase